MTETAKRILVVDDDITILSLLRELLTDEGYEVVTAKTGREALGAIVNQKPQLVIMDLSLPDMNGLEILEQMSTARNPIPVLLVTAHGSPNDAIKGVQLGAVEFITKPFDLGKLVTTVRKGLEVPDEPRAGPSAGAKRVPPPRGTIVGLSEKMLDVYQLIGKVAKSDVTVLIEGETGTGKELVAGAVHANSGRREGPFVKVACAALPESLLESELFGHEKGAFTSAVAQRKGRFELADGGTIFLDEVGEMSLGTQKKLLRVLQEREFERVGGARPLPVDVRVVAATNRRLAAEVEAGRFRQDLYYRLNVIAVRLPPLRERLEDVPQLVEHFLDKHRAHPAAPPARISREAVEALLRHAWPGNVRELENVIERAVVLSGGRTIMPEHLRLSDLEGAFPAPASELSPALRHFLDKQWSLDDAVADFEAQAIMHTLIETNWRAGEAARRLGLSSDELGEKMRRYGLDDHMGQEVAETVPAESAAPAP